MNRAEIQRQFTTINRRYENKYLGKVKEALMPGGLLETVRNYGATAGISLLNNQISNPQLNSVVRSLYVNVGLKHAQVNFTRMREETRTRARIGRKETVIDLELKDLIKSIETKAGFGFNPTWTKFILDYLERFLLEKITFEVARTTRDKMIEILQESIRQGVGVDETVKRLEGLPFIQSQAARIVRTEINRAANVGAKAQAETFQYEQMKEWISAHDSRVRGFDPKDHASHIGLDGIRINEGDLFQDPRNGDLLEFPGDVRASAESTINCRCSVAYVAKRDGNGRLIPKRQTTTVIFPRQNVRRQIVLI